MLTFLLSVNPFQLQNLNSFLALNLAQKQANHLLQLNCLQTKNLILLCFSLLLTQKLLLAKRNNTILKTFLNQTPLHWKSKLINAMSDEEMFRKRRDLTNSTPKRNHLKKKKKLMRGTVLDVNHSSMRQVVLCYMLPIVSLSLT